MGISAAIYDAALIMTKYSIRRLPIARDNVLLGIVTTTDLARRIYEKNKEDPVLKAMSRFRQLEEQQQ
jgi:CBS domain-containing protein